MNLQRVVLGIDMVLAGRVEVELSEIVCLAVADESAMGLDLNGGAQVHKLGALRRSVDVDCGPSRDAARGAREVDRRLVSTLGAERVVFFVERIPVERALKAVVAKCWLFHLR